MDGPRPMPEAPTRTSDADLSLDLRPSRPGDMAAVQAIYAHYVLGHTATFEETPPDVDEMARRRGLLLGRNLPYLVAAHGDSVLGYAYAAPFRERSAYRYTVEDSIYVHPESVGLGIGGRLLAQLIDRCRDLGYRQMVAVIGDSANVASIRLHGRLGFTPAGTLTGIGFKFGRWIDSVYMQRPIDP